MGMMTAIELIAAECVRQVDEEGYSPEHDDGHEDDSLAMAAATYATPDRHREANWRTTHGPAGWPWSKADWKPTPDDRIRELVKAGALVVKEIERLQRAEVEDAD